MLNSLEKGDIMKCQYCNAQISDDSKFCERCGRNLMSPPPMPQTPPPQTPQAPPQTPQAPQKKSGAGCIIGVIAGLLVLGLLVLFIIIVGVVAFKNFSANNDMTKNDATKSETGTGNLFSESEQEITPQSAFQDYLAESIVDFIASSEEVGMMRLNSLVEIENQESMNQSIITKNDIAIVNEEESVMIHQETLYDATTGNASKSQTISAGSEMTSTSGWYFVNGELLIDNSDEEIPMIRYVYPITGEVAKTSVYERIDLLLSNKLEKKADGDWEEIASEYCNALSPNEEKYSVADATIDINGTLIDTKNYTYSQTGEEASKQIYQLAKLFSENNYYEGYLYKIIQLYELSADSMDHASSSMVITVSTINDNPIGLMITGNYASKPIYINVQKYGDGYDKQESITMNIMDELTLFSEAKNFKNSEQKYDCAIQYSLNDQRANDMMANYSENFSLTGTGVIEESKSLNYDCNMSLQTTYMSANPDEDEDGSGKIQISGPMNYTQSKDQDQVLSQIQFQNLSFGLGEETSNLSNFSIQTSQGAKNVSVAAPQFIEGSGRTVSTLEELYQAMGMEITSDQYRKLPVSFRMVLTSLF